MNKIQKMCRKYCIIPKNTISIWILPFSITCLDITIQYHMSGYYHSVSHIWILPFSITYLDITIQYHISGYYHSVSQVWILPFSITYLDITIQYHRSGYYHSVCFLETHLWFNVLLQRHVWLIENDCYYSRINIKLNEKSISMSLIRNQLYLILLSYPCFCKLVHMF
jgi:hypothetical protein